MWLTFSRFGYRRYTHTTPGPSRTYEINLTIEIIQKKVESGNLTDQVARGYSVAFIALVYRKASYTDISPEVHDVQVGQSLHRA